jgi:predicted transcriptional regulator
VIQPAVGWAKYLELSEDEVTEFLVGLLGESKRKDVEKGWKYVRELEFTVPESVKWAGKTRGEWEGEVIAYLQFRREVSRQELLKEVFANQKWLCDMIMDGLADKGIVTFDFVVHGRGRPRKVYRLAEEVRIPLRKAVGCEEEVFYLINNQEGKIKVFQGISLSREERDDFSQRTNSSVRRAVGGGWIGEQDEEVGSSVIGEGEALREGLGSFLGRVNSYQSSFSFNGDVGSDDDGGDLVQLWEAGLIDF